MATPQKPGSPSGGWGAAGGGGGKPATPHDPALLAALQQQAGGGSLAFAPYAEEAPFLGGGGGPSLDGSGGAGFDGGAAAAAGAPAPQMDESANEEVMHYLAVLAEYQLLSEKAGNYEECARVTDTVAALRQQEEGRRVQALKARHVSERASVAAAQTQQFKDFNASWDRYLSEYDAMATLYVQQMQEKQLLKLRAQQEALHGELVKKPVKFGREVIEWRGREAVLVKHHKYSEAARIKAVVEELERRERARIDEERLVVFSQREANFRLHQRAELEALLKRVGSRRDGACVPPPYPPPSPPPLLRARASHSFSRRPPAACAHAPLSPQSTPSSARWTRRACCSGTRT